MSQDELNETAYRLLPKKQFSAMAEFLEGKSSRIFSLYLRPIFTTVKLEYYKENSYIGELIGLFLANFTH
ncbi:hypothetical protein [Acidithiobacillus sulfurivorans]|uniref:Uncharacterized protein n=1 Tax=Acidithiobacillus sulfurivorans TaxID=1958756 RepID=A0ABS6A165_9PROT|nr:hypothetical protein [Acidithiobacillus sulfurivorans]MBU2761234.1 hypothetical protein [Acidithiobacillus sulfurivorans]